MNTRRLAAAGFALAVTLLAVPASAQVDVDERTEVRKIRFRGTDELSERELRAVILTKDRGAAYGLRSSLGKVPLVPDPTFHSFSPLELQRDVVRLRRAYAQAGFASARVDYEVARDEKENLLDVTFVVDEGPPLVVSSVRIVGPDSVGAVSVAPEDRDSWKRIERMLHKLEGHRLEITDARERLRRATAWWRDHGHPVAVVRPSVTVDTTRAEAQLTVRVVPGPEGRFGPVAIEGNQDVTTEPLLRQVPIEPGERYSASAIEQTRTNLQGLDIVRTAQVEAPDSVAPATGSWVLPVHIQVVEKKSQVVSGELGYVTDAGVSSEVKWGHVNFTGGARTLTLSALAQTGWLAVTDDPEKRYRGSASLKQPGFLLPRGTGVLTPFVEWRDDASDRSTQLGTNLTYVYTIQGLRSVSLDYQIARRDVDEYHFGDLASGDIDLLTFLTQISQGLLDSLGTTLQSSNLTLSAGIGSLDDPANPRLGYIFRPSIQTTAPNAWSSTSYWRADATANGFVPLSRRTTLAVRSTSGRLFPYGKSLPVAGENPTARFLELRDATFTAGGTTNVRGWENRLLGPKVPDIRFEESGDTLVSNVDGYVPLGGFARATFSFEMQMPLPGFGPNFGTHAFFDGGRVWSDDERFGLDGDPNGQEKLFLATGGGVDMKTPVGPIKLSVAYKLNPSITDLVEADDLLRTAREGRPLSDAPHKNSRRWQWHLAIGASY